MKSIVQLLIAVMLTTTLLAQSRMDKDLEITSNILQASLMPDNHFGLSGNSPVEASFKENYGVIYTVSSGFGNWTSVIEIKDGLEEMTFDFQGQEGDAPMVVTTNTVTKGKDMVKKIKDFMADYAHLNRELSNDHKIMVKLAPRSQFNNQFFAGVGNNKENKRMTVEVDFSDVKSFQSGNLTREKLFEKIKVEEMDIMGSEPEYRIFGNVLEDLFSSRNSQSYYMNRSPNYERIKDLGIRYYVKVYSSWRSKKNNYRMPTLGLDEVTEDERNNYVEELYPVFIEDFKKAILDYGSILNKIELDEPIEFEISLTECECEIAEKIEIVVSKKTIDQYRNESISMDEAMAQIRLKEL